MYKLPSEKSEKSGIPPSKKSGSVAGKSPGSINTGEQLWTEFRSMFPRAQLFGDYALTGAPQSESESEKGKWFEELHETLQNLFSCSALPDGIEGLFRNLRGLGERLSREMSKSEWGGKLSEAIELIDLIGEKHPEAKVGLAQSPELAAAFASKAKFSINTTGTCEKRSADDKFEDPATAYENEFLRVSGRIGTLTRLGMGNAQTRAKTAAQLVSLSNVFMRADALCAGAFARRRILENIEGTCPVLSGRVDEFINYLEVTRRQFAEVSPESRPWFYIDADVKTSLLKSGVLSDNDSTLFLGLLFDEVDDRYFSKMAAAYEFIFSIKGNRSIDYSLIQEINAKVTGSNRSVVHESMCYGLVESTQPGIDELKVFLTDPDVRSVLTPAYHDRGIGDDCRIVTRADENADVFDALWKQDMHGGIYMFASCLPERKCLLENAIAEYKSNVSSHKNSKDELLRDGIRLAKKLDLLHVFPDGNARTGLLVFHLSNILNSVGLCTIGPCHIESHSTEELAKFAEKVMKSIDEKAPFPMAQIFVPTFSKKGVEDELKKLEYTGRRTFLGSDPELPFFIPTGENEDAESLVAKVSINDAPKDEDDFYMEGHIYDVIDDGNYSNK